MITKGYRIYLALAVFFFNLFCTIFTTTKSRFFNKVYIFFEIATIIFLGFWMAKTFDRHVTFLTPRK